MTYSKIVVDKTGSVAIVRLNNPATLNAIDLQMTAELIDAVPQVAQTSRALVLTGAGKAFCAGADLSGDAVVDANDGLPDLGATLESHINPLMMMFSQLPIPFISAVRGPAAGVGCSLALVADMIVASEGAYFLQAFARVGLVPDGGATWLLSRAIGRVRAMEMMLTGARVPAAMALAWGLINRVTSDDTLEQVALELATNLANGPTRSLALTRQIAWSAMDATWSEALLAERWGQRKAGRTADHKEGVAAFREKRSARFTGS